jgi:putative ABC transport system permease protein
MQSLHSCSTITTHTAFKFAAMVNLARKTILHEWRRFAPAIFAVAFSGVLLFVQAGLAVGMFDTIAVYIRKSGADLWIVSPGTRSIDQGRPLDSNIEVFARMNPHVTRVEQFSWGGGLWKAAGRAGETPVYLTGIDTSPDGLVLARALTTDLRAKLKWPNTVLVDLSERDNLKVDIGSHAEINGTRVQVVGFVEGMRALGGINVISSLLTARNLDPSMRSSDSVAYFIVKVDRPENVDSVQSALSPKTEAPRYEAISASEFADRTTYYFLFESGMGTVFLLSSLIAFFVSLMITSQTLMAAVAASVREYATMRALGVSAGKLRRVVLTQSGWVGIVGIAVSAAVSGVIFWIAIKLYVPIAVSVPIAGVCAAMVMAAALFSGLVALFQLNKADPATLLR